MSRAYDLGKWGGKTALGESRNITLTVPQVGDNFVLFWTNTALTLASSIATVRGTSPSVTFSIYSGANRDGTSNNIMLNSNVCTNTTTGFIPGAYTNTAIAASTFVWVYISAVSGTVDEFNLSLRF